jgi:thymidine kinase
MLTIVHFNSNFAILTLLEFKVTYFNVYFIDEKAFYKQKEVNILRKYVQNATDCFISGFYSYRKIVVH